MTAAYLLLDSKFWTIEVRGSETIVHFGKITSNGQKQTKQHRSAAEAEKFALKQITAKKKKGYSDSPPGDNGSKKRKHQADDAVDDNEDDDCEDDVSEKKVDALIESAQAKALKQRVSSLLNVLKPLITTGLEKILTSSVFKKSTVVFFEVQPDGLQHTGLPVQCFLFAEDSKEISSVSVLPDNTPANPILPMVELEKIYICEDEDEDSSKGFMEYQSEAVVIWLAALLQSMLRKENNKFMLDYMMIH